VTTTPSFQGRVCYLASVLDDTPAPEGELFVVLAVRVAEFEAIPPVGSSVTVERPAEPKPPPEPKMSREEYIEAITRWLMPDQGDPEFAAEVRAKTGLDGVYKGKSWKTTRMVKLAFLRGVRRGAGLAWEARQPVVLRASETSEVES
jgi:hypothetical protein